MAVVAVCLHVCQLQLHELLQHLLLGSLLGLRMWCTSCVGAHSAWACAWAGGVACICIIRIMQVMCHQHDFSEMKQLDSLEMP